MASMIYRRIRNSDGVGCCLTTHCTVRVFFQRNRKSKQLIKAPLKDTCGVGCRADCTRAVSPPDSMVEEGVKGDQLDLRTPCTGFIAIYIYPEDTIGPKYVNDWKLKSEGLYKEWSPISRLANPLLRFQGCGCRVWLAETGAVGWPFLHKEPRFDIFY